MKYIVFLSILLASFSIIGCKEKRVRYFQYEIVNNESICSLKPKEIFESKEFSMFDTFFRDMDGNPNDELSETIYRESLKNLSNKLTKITKHAKRHFWLNDVCTCHGLLPSHSA